MFSKIHAASARRDSIPSVLSSAMRRGFEPRLLVLFTLGTLLPTTFVAVPVWRVLADALDHVPRVPELARHFDMTTFEDLSSVLGRASKPLGGVVSLATLLAAALGPFFTGMLLASAHAERALGFGGLLEGGLRSYGRAFRLWLFSLIPLGLAASLAGLASGAADDFGKHAVLESQATLASRAALLVSGLVLLWVHVSMEAGRAELGAHAGLRSGFRAWLAGARRSVRQPGSVLALYLGASALSLLLALVLLLIRVRVTGADSVSFWFGVLLTQLAVASIGWGKASRLFALSALARATPAMPAADALPRANAP
jgi:hypothetical protein